MGVTPHAKCHPVSTWPYKSRKPPRVSFAAAQVTVRGGNRTTSVFAGQDGRYWLLVLLMVSRCTKFVDGSWIYAGFTRYRVRDCCAEIIKMYVPPYYRRPSFSELDAISEKYESIGFKGYIGEIYCYNIGWQIFSSDLKGT